MEFFSYMLGVYILVAVLLATGQTYLNVRVLYADYGMQFMPLFKGMLAIWTVALLLLYTLIYLLS